MLQRTNLHSNLQRSDGTPADAASARAVACDHAALFYQSDTVLANRVARFAAVGLSRGEAVVIVATREHRAAVVDALRERRIDVDAVTRTGQLHLRDARETLAAIMDQGRPNSDRLDGIFAETLQSLDAQARAVHIRVYGEMVDLLVQDGNAGGAVRLEELWNERVRETNITLLCSYAMRNFSSATHDGALAEICRQHTRVTPTEKFLEQDPAGRRVQVVLLQQRAQALATELERRKRLETRLRRTSSAAKRARTAAVVANRARSQFLAVMSHELRTPLNAIGGYTELLELGIHGPVSDDQRDSLARIQRNQRHLLDLINQVLDYSRLETGGLCYDIGDVVLAQAFGVVEELARPKMAAKDLRYARLGVAPIIVRADRDKLQQILLNLLNNATTFTPTGGAIDVDCTTDATTVYVSVRDTGVGISSERLPTIFDPFAQVGAGYTRTSDGIGLGLAISRELARGMKGSLGVVSVVGQGSMFTLALPRLVR